MHAFLPLARHKYRRSFLALALAVVLNGCTFLNKETFEIQPDNLAKREVVLHGIEAYFEKLGIKLARKTDYLYPEKRKKTTYFLGQSRDPTPLHSSYSYIVLRLEASDMLYIDWVKISDLREKAKPGEFDSIHQKIADDLMEHIGIPVKFTYIENAVP